MSDYLAYAIRTRVGFANPVEEVYPSLRCRFSRWMTARRTWHRKARPRSTRRKTASSLRVVWKKWGRVPAPKPTERNDISITSDVSWQISGDTLTHLETLVADHDLKIKRWWVTVPTTADNSRVETTKGGRTDVFTGGEGRLAVAATADWPLDVSLRSTGDSKLSKGPLRAIPLHLIYSSPGSAIAKRCGRRHGHSSFKYQGKIMAHESSMIGATAQFKAMVTDWSSIPVENIGEGIDRQMVVGQDIMICRLRFGQFVVTPGAPAHARADDARHAGQGEVRCGGR